MANRWSGCRSLKMSLVNYVLWHHLSLMITWPPYRLRISIWLIALYHLIIGRKDNESIRLYYHRVWYAVLFGWCINRRKHTQPMALDMGCYSHHLDYGFDGCYGHRIPNDKTLRSGRDLFPCLFCACDTPLNPVWPVISTLLFFQNCWSNFIKCPASLLFPIILIL